MSERQPSAKPRLRPAAARREFDGWGDLVHREPTKEPDWMAADAWKLRPVKRLGRVQNRHPIIMLLTMTSHRVLEPEQTLRFPLRRAGLLLTARSFLGVAGLLLAACGRRDTGDWTMRVDTLRSGADPARVAASLRTNGKEGPEGAARTHDVVLSLDCFGDNATVAIMSDQALRQGSTDVRMSVDGARPRTIKGFAGTTTTGGKVLLTITQDSLMAWLNGHRRAVVNYADGAGSYQTTAEFPIVGVQRHRARFLAVCAGSAKQR